MNDHNLEALVQELIKKVPKQYSDLVLESISWAQKYYAGQNRLSGENTIFHALRVANNALDLHLDTNSVIVAIIHSLLKDENEDLLPKVSEEIKEKFGQEVLELMQILRKINQGTDSIETDKKIITRYVLRNSEDVRSILIKICDVLDDLRTVGYLPEEMIKEKAEKVFDIYAPLCSYLNLEPIKKEMEEIVFKHTKPEDYKVIAQKMEDEGLNNELLAMYISGIEKITSDILDYKPKVFGRIKSKYSMYNKLRKLENEGKGTALSKIKDRIAISLLARNEDDCFLIKMALEDKIIVNDQETDDYITQPKPNGFRALQISVSCPEIKDIFIEVQVLTYQMYYINTYGPASHIAYKASKTRFAKPTDSFNWVEDLHKQILNCESCREQSRSVPIKADIFKNYIYVFTPGGRIIELNKDATALDFAYRVHTKIGHKAMFAQVDGERKELSAILETGQVVNIVTSKQDKFPKREWLDFTVADSTKEKIRKALKIKSNI